MTITDSTSGANEKESQNHPEAWTDGKEIGTVPEISVVIPVYNRAGVVARAVRSVQAQTVPVREIVLVDDGSVDGTPEVLAQLASGDRRIRVITQVNRGVAAARNAGLGAATGGWIAFLDSDDEWREDHVALTVPHISAPDSGFLFTGKLSKGGHETILNPILDPAEAEDKAWLMGRFLVKTSTVMFRRDLLEKSGMFREDLKTCEDYEFFWRLIAVAPRVVYLPERSVTIHLGDDGLTRANSDEYLRRDDIRALEIAYNWLVSKGFSHLQPQKLRRTQYWTFVDIMRERLKQRDWRGFVADAAWCSRNLGFVKGVKGALSALRG